MTRWVVLVSLSAIAALLMQQSYIDSRLGSTMAETAGRVTFLVVVLLLIGITSLVGKLRQRHA